MKLDKLFTIFYRTTSIGKRSKLCLKILKILNKNYSLLVWSIIPSDRADIFFGKPRSFKVKDFALDYYSRFNSSNGKEIVLSLGLSFDQSDGSLEYEFEVVSGYTFRLCYEIFRGAIYTPPRVTVVFQEKEFPLKCGYYLQELYNKISNELKTFAEQQKLRSISVNTLDEDTLNLENI